ncbi:class I SAM-dependent methyltransferase [Planctopirus hydrillae]|uniref:Methyltransferase type 11 domain-containing protein n=1 Tax=Planctopirus hydrillae TaxID=1841610 RepID=A0A1C3EN72_9PLAN|nr:methyltransferase domain-containing protein [Planctopirus hydrillae]ODA34672.1 hypothetical protein A6X21_03070 [Planctopirus hydrillae]
MDAHTKTSQLVSESNTGSAKEPSLAYGVDPTRPEKYSLRQARYHAVSEEIARLIPEFKASGRRLKILDVGIWNGVLMRYVEALPGSEIVDLHGVDLTLQPTIYKPEKWASLNAGDLMGGLNFLESNQFDLVVCEQVLEHLPTVDDAISTLGRVLAPGGLLIVGVPIFPEGIHLVRKHLVPAVDKLVGKKKPRGHLQAFSKRTFIGAVTQHAPVKVVAARGFRIFSGGLLRPLENQKWWWQLNRTAGETLPSLCTEIQVLARKAA